MPEEALGTKGDRQTAAAAVIARNGRFLAGLRNYKTQQYKDGDFWTTPGGRCDEGETVGEALIRETEEEIGVTDLVVKEFLGVVPGAKDGDRVFLFLCETESEPRLREPEKFKEWKWASPNEVADSFLNPAALDVIRRRLSG